MAKGNGNLSEIDRLVKSFTEDSDYRSSSSSSSSEGGCDCGDPDCHCDSRGDCHCGGSKGESVVPQPDLLQEDAAPRMAAVFAKDAKRLEAFVRRGIKSENGRRMAEWKAARVSARFERVLEQIKARHEDLRKRGERMAEEYGFVLEGAQRLKEMHLTLRARAIVAEALRSVPIPEAERPAVVRRLAEYGTREELVEGLRRVKAHYAEAVAAPIPEPNPNPRGEEAARLDPPSNVTRLAERRNAAAGAGDEHLDDKAKKSLGLFESVKAVERLR
jgi:hypothetical protein